MEKEKNIHLNKQQRSTNKGKGWKDGSHYSYPWHHNSMKNCPRPIQNHKTPEGQKLTKTKRRFAAVQWQNRRVLPRPEWLRLTWKGMKRFEKFALWGEEGAVPLRGGTSLDSHCCLLLSRRRWNREMELAPPATFCPPSGSSPWIRIERFACIGLPHLENPWWQHFTPHYSKDEGIRNTVFVLAYWVRRWTR